MAKEPTIFPQPHRCTAGNREQMGGTRCVAERAFETGSGCLERIGQGTARPMPRAEDRGVVSDVVYQFNGVRYACSGKPT